MWQSYSILFPQETIWTQKLRKRHFSNSDTCRIVRGKNIKCLTIWQVNTNYGWSFKKAWSEGEIFAWRARKFLDGCVMVLWHDITNPERKDNVHIGKNEGEKCYMQKSLSSFNPNPEDTDVFKTSSGRLKKVSKSCDQTRRHQDVLQKTSDLRRLEDVRFTSSWRRPIYDVFKTSDLRRLADVWFKTSWRHPIYDVLNTSDLRRLEDVRFTTSLRRLIYGVLKTSVKRRICSNFIATSIKRRKRLFFLIIFRKF